MGTSARIYHFHCHADSLSRWITHAIFYFKNASKDRPATPVHFFICTLIVAHFIVAYFLCHGRHSTEPQDARYMDTLRSHCLQRHVALKSGMLLSMAFSFDFSMPSMEAMLVGMQSGMLLSMAFSCDFSMPSMDAMLFLCNQAFFCPWLLAPIPRSHPWKRCLFPSRST